LTIIKLKLGPDPRRQARKVSLELPAQFHRSLAAYADTLARKADQPLPAPVN
jgi:hypothetical protein